jgi:hypothetical protein
VERLEREVKEAKADVLRLSSEGLLMKETMAEFQRKTNKALEVMVANHQTLIACLSERDDNLRGALDKRDDRLDRHSKKLGEDSNRVIAAFFFDCEDES